MRKILLLPILIVVLVTISLFVYQYLQDKKINLNPINSSDLIQDKIPKTQVCKDKQTNVSLTYQEALEIARKDSCLNQPMSIALTDNYFCNEETGTFWIDLAVQPKEKGCNPACVVSVIYKTSGINWRCTGLIPSQ